MVWSSIQDKINPRIKIKNYDKFRFNSNIDLPGNTIIELTVCSYYVTYAIQSESTVYSCLNVKELLARSRREI